MQFFPRQIADEQNFVYFVVFFPDEQQLWFQWDVFHFGGAVETSLETGKKMRNTYPQLQKGFSSSDPHPDTPEYFIRFQTQI